MNIYECTFILTKWGDKLTWLIVAESFENALDRFNKESLSRSGGKDDGIKLIQIKEVNEVIL